METRSFNKASLKEFIESELFDELETLPISKHRAISQINNPRAEDEDVLLVVQFDGKKTVGYLGILPDFFFHKGIKEKIGWLTCFWVDDDYKSHGVAANLFRRVIRTWKQKILITNIVPSLEHIYLRTNLFYPTLKKTGFRAYLKFNLGEILPPKKAIFSKSAGLLGAFDRFSNFFADKRFLFFNNDAPTKAKYEYLLNFDTVPEEIISGTFSENFNQRGKDELNWIVNYPWVIEGASTDYNSKRYYFSSLSHRFFNQILCIKDNNGKTDAVLLINVRNNDLRIPYFFGNKKNMDPIAELLIQKMLELKLSMITTFNKQLGDALRKKSRYFIYSKSVQKTYFISKKIDFGNELLFQDGDGDCAFY